MNIKVTIKTLGTLQRFTDTTSNMIGTISNIHSNSMYVNKYTCLGRVSLKYNACIGHKSNGCLDTAI